MAKPEKGKKLHAGNILALLDHAASHPLPTEEEVGQAPPQFVEESLPVSQVNTKPLPYSIASSKSPNAYKVNRNKKIVRASHFREVDYTGYGQVEHSNLGYSVVLFAANAKHASLIGLRLIQQFIDTKKEGS